MDSKSINLTSLENIASIHQRLVASLRSFFKNAGMQKAVLGLKKKYGKNAVLKGMNFQEGATMIDRNGQIGGHKA